MIRLRFVEAPLIQPTEAAAPDGCILRVGHAAYIGNGYEYCRKEHLVRQSRNQNADEAGCFVYVVLPRYISLRCIAVQQLRVI